MGVRHACPWVRRLGGSILVGVVLVGVGVLADHQPTPSASATTLVSTNVVARVSGSKISLYHRPSSARAFASMANPTPTGGPVVFLVSHSKYVAHWIEVYLPTRPNDSRAWVHLAAVRLSRDPYAVLVDLAQHRLRVTRGTRVVYRTTVGVGRPSLPTPTGRFYVVELLRQPDPTGAYGPYAFGLSAHSDVLKSFDGGTAQIGLHGTNVPSSVGASVSHGCLRVSAAAITHLAHLLPLGTPVEISN